MVIAAAIAFVAYRVWLYRKHRVYRIVPRVQVMELAKQLQSEEAGKILLVDVRSHGYYDSGAARIRGSIRIEPNNLSQEVDDSFPRTRTSTCTALDSAKPPAPVWRIYFASRDSTPLSSWVA